jgi:hypothetical protein
MMRYIVREYQVVTAESTQAAAAVVAAAAVAASVAVTIGSV